MSELSINNPEKYSLGLRLLHWTMLGCFIALFVIGMEMVDLPKDDPNRPNLFALHKSFGVLSMLLLSVRVYCRLRKPQPLPVISGGTLQTTLATWVHKVLYALMLIVPIVGWSHSDLHGRGVKLFGLPMPKLFPTIEGIGGWPGEIHGYLAYGLLCLVAVHVAGVLKQHWVYQNQVMRRMW